MMPMPLVAQLADDREQVLRLARRQRRRRLVHDDDARVQRQRLGDLDHLHLPGRQRARPACAAAGEPHALQQRARVRVLIAARPSGAQSRRARALVAEEDVRRDVEVRREHQLLVDQRDAEPLRVAHAGEASTALPVDQDLALVGLLRAAEDLHQRALAGAVLPHQRQHLARAESSETSRSATTPGKRLVIAAHLEQQADGAGVVARGGHVATCFISASCSLNSATLSFVMTSRRCR